jgi:serine protease Do
MSTRKTTLFYSVLIAVASLAVGMVIASRLDLTPISSAQTIEVPPMNSAPLTGPLSASTFRDIARAVTPSVVNIKTEMRAHGEDLQDFFGSSGGGGGSDNGGDFFRRFFGPPDDQGQGGGGSAGPHRRDPIARAAGTGFVISKDGFILTNNHVVQDAIKIQVSLFDEPDMDYEAKVIGRDELTDSALIQLVDKPDHPLQVVKFGDSSQVAAGDWVMAIGNPFGYEHTVTVGVISATQRAYQVTDGRTNEMLQTDAAINPGNSGGPLLNIRGEVIGMNTAIISDGRSEGNIGIGFAVPSNTVRDLLPQLRRGKVTRGRIGVEVSEVPPEGYQDFGLSSRAGAIVASVAPNGAASKAGVQPGDVIVEFNGHTIDKSSDLVKMVVGTAPGTTVPIKVLRDKKPVTLNLTVEELDLAAEQGRSRNGNAPEPPEQEGSDSFGLTLSNLTPQIARRLQVPDGQSGAVITDVDPSGPSAGRLQAGDVVISINRQPISSAAEAGRALQQVESGRLAQILVWRAGNEVFVTVPKE